jgi:hypothetical protein
MKYTEKQLKAIIEQLQPVSDNALHASYDDMLDDVHGDVTIGEYSYPTSMALKQVDHVAYRCGFVDWLDAEISNEVYTDEIEGGHYWRSQVDQLLDLMEEREEQ